MAEKFAPESAVKDKRVQDMAFQDVRLSVKTITETVAFQPSIAVKQGVLEVQIPTEGKVKVPSGPQLVTIKDEAKLIKEDGASSAADKGAAEIIEKVAEKQIEDLANKKSKTKVRFSKSRDMFSSIKLYLLPDSVTQPKAYAKVILYSQLKEKHNDYLTATRSFSGGSVVNSDKLLKASSGAVNVLPAPVQKEVPYGDL